MRRAASFYAVLVSFLAAGALAFGQTDAKKVCTFSIAGMWRSDATTETTPVFFNFSPEGYVTLMSHAADTLPQDLEIITAVSYKLDNAAAPKSIEFTAHRGNDLFAPGVTSLKIIEYDDNSFTTLDPASEHKTRWERMQTHLYFLTFAARGDSAFAVWTVLDGRNAETEALGVQLARDGAGKLSPVFGLIPPELYNQLSDEDDKEKKGNKAESVFMRLELNGAEFELTRAIYQAWEKQAKTQSLPNADAYLNAAEFMRKAAESLNRCGERVKLLGLSQRERDEFISKNNAAQFLLEYVRAMRKKNDEMHVSNRVFPWGWRPALQLHGQ